MSMERSKDLKSEFNSKDALFCVACIHRNIERCMADSAS